MGSAVIQSVPFRRPESIKDILPNIEFYRFSCAKIWFVLARLSLATGTVERRLLQKQILEKSSIFN